MGLSTRITDVRSASAIVTLPFIVLQFISGVFFVFTDLPGWIQSVASVFPLRWLALAMREAMLPDFFETVETGGTWQLDTVALVLGAWVIGGSILVLRSFRIRGER